MPSFLRRPAPVLLLALLAAACGGGGPGDRGIVEPPPLPEPPPAPVPQDTLQRLLTDAEIATPLDASAPEENAEWASWIRANHVPVRSLTSTTDYADLQFLKPLLAGRRVVQLGESGHGVRQFNQAKARLIRFLHQEMGFEVLAFESSLHDCWQANRGLDTLSGRQALRECAFAVWHTEEVLPLLDYVQQTAGTARPLVLAGVDVQPTTRRTMGLARAGLLREVLAVVDPALAERVHATDADLAQQYVSDAQGWFVFLESRGDSLSGIYREAETVLDANAALLAAHFADDPEKPVVARATARSMRVFTAYVPVSGQAAGFSARDAGMADNLDVLLDELYPGKKVIVWAHNSHIMNRVAHPGHVGMGSHLHARRGHEVYTVGLYAYTGTMADNRRQVYPIRMPHQAGSLESILYRPRRRWTFVDFSRPGDGAGTGWMFQRTLTRSWGVNDEVLVPRDFYDGVLFIHTTTPPVYLPSSP